MKRIFFTLLAAVGALLLAQATAQAAGSTDEHRFIVAAVRDNLPNYVIPGGGHASHDDVLASGYKARAALDQYPTDSMRATRAFYPSGNEVDGDITYEGQMFVLYAADFLCNRHAHLYENF
jgi:serine/threonine protein kinase, bacterial